MASDIYFLFLACFKGFDMGGGGNGRVGIWESGQERGRSTCAVFSQIEET
jgi:hypothetical protein